MKNNIENSTEQISFDEIIDETNTNEENIIEFVDPFTIETTSVDDIDQNTEEISSYSEDEIVENEDKFNDKENLLENENEDQIVKVKVNASALNIRKDANKDADILTIVYKDDILELMEPDVVDGFYYVKTDSGIEGFCMTQFVELI